MKSLTSFSTERKCAIIPTDVDRERDIYIYAYKQDDNRDPLLSIAFFIESVPFYNYFLSCLLKDSICKSAVRITIVDNYF